MQRKIRKITFPVIRHKYVRYSLHYNPNTFMLYLRDKLAENRRLIISILTFLLVSNFKKSIGNNKWKQKFQTGNLIWLGSSTKSSIFYGGSSLGGRITWFGLTPMHGSKILLILERGSPTPVALFIPLLFSRVKCALGFLGFLHSFEPGLPGIWV